MVLTKEKVTILNEFLNADPGRTEKLATLAPSEAVAQINAYGHNFTTDELIEYGEAVSHAAANEGALDLDALDDVAGGSVTLVCTVVTCAVGVINSIRSVRW